MAIESLEKQEEALERMRVAQERRRLNPTEEERRIDNSQEMRLWVRQAESDGGLWPTLFRLHKRIEAIEAWDRYGAVSNAADPERPRKGR